MPNVRSKVASRISRIKEAEDFNFSNWLKKPAVHHHPIESINSYLKDLSEVQIEFTFSDISKYKFDWTEPEVKDELKNCDFAKVRSNAIFFMIAYPSDPGMVFLDVELRHVSFSARIVEFIISNPLIKKIKVKFDYSPPINFDCKLELPASFNYLSDLQPEIFNIDLLDFEDIAASAKKVNVQKFDFNKTAKKVSVKNFDLAKFKKTKVDKFPLPGLPEMKKVFRIKVPPIGVFKSNQQKISFTLFTQPEVTESFSFELKKVKNYYAKFKLARGDSFLYYKPSGVKYISEKSLKSTGSEDYSRVDDQLRFILSNVRKVDWEQSKRFHIKLRQYEESAVKFLIDSDYALLQDEFGIDTEIEVIAALKILFGNRVIKSALIITDGIKMGNPKFAKHLNLELGWTDKLKKHCPELSLNLVIGNNDERADLWNKSKSITIADIDTSLNDYRLKIFEENRLNKFDCIIIDSVDSLSSIGEMSNEFLSSIKPKTLWAISSILDPNLHSQINNNLNPYVRIERAKVRSKESILAEAPRFILNEYWCDSDENQIGEFKSALSEAKKDLRRVLESGNPLRFAANIFTLFHRLNQLGNFASAKAKSPKADILLKHVMNIKANGKKALVLSQYEKFGIRKIEALFNGHGIKHIVAPNGLSAEEMKQAISTFQSQKDIVAFISDAKNTKLKFTDIEVPYVIRFDQWWNPIANWELEDMFTRNGEEVLKESINILNYYSTGTLDQKIRELLLENNLMNRNVFELMQAKYYEELISIDDWLKIFGMPVSSETKNVQTPEEALKLLQKMSFDDFRKLLSRFFTIIGYSEVDILELPNSNSYNMVGKAQRNSRLFFLIARVFVDGKVDQTMIESVLTETSSSKQDKVFIISRDSLPEIDNRLIRDNVALIDGLLLSKFIIRFGILPKQQ